LKVQKSLSECAIVKEDGGYVLQLDKKPIRTPGGLPLRSPSTDLLRHLIKEFEYQGYKSVTIQDHAITAPRFLGGYTILATQLEFVAAGQVHASDVRDWATSDRSIAVLEATMQDRPEFAYKAAVRLQELGFAALPSKAVASELEQYLTKTLAEWDSLRPCGKSVVINLCSVHDNPFLFALLLATGRYTPEDYATGVLIRDLMERTLADTSREGREQRVAVLQDDAQACLDYLKYWPG
jgi:hypothetical protein